MKRTLHSLSHYHLTTMEMGKLYPVCVYDVIPGDTIQHHTSALIRLSPPVRPVMHPVVVRFHTWYVPYRLLWDDFADRFITGGDGAEVGVSFPYIQAHAVNGFSAKGLADYFGVKPGTSGASLQISALRHRAYALIWNKNYRDQDLQSEIAFPTTGGADATTPDVVQSISWEKDRFTLARPWPQKGPDVSLPLGSQAPVMGLFTGAVNTAAPGASVAIGGAAVGTVSQAGATLTAASKSAVGTAAATAFNATNANVYADLSTATAATVNELREAMALQRYQEARAMYGSEYVDYLRYLGIRPSDARHQRPEYLGGAKQTITWSEIVQTSEPAVDNPLGQLGGHGMSAMRTRPYRHFFEEHGCVMTLMSVRPRTVYTDGLQRDWSLRVKEDFWQKELEHIGQEPIYRRELWSQSDANGGNTVFGYNDRYSYLRGIPSRVSAEFRDVAMSDWHLARMLGGAPTLNSTFITCDPSDRIFADQTANADHLWCMINHKIAARRMVGRGGQVGRIQ